MMADIDEYTGIFYGVRMLLQVHLSRGVDSLLVCPSTTVYLLPCLIHGACRDHIASWRKIDTLGYSDLIYVTYVGSLI